MVTLVLRIGFSVYAIDSADMIAVVLSTGMDHSFSFFRARNQ
jgi:hypothetical protein